MDFFLYARWLSTDSNSLLLPFFLAISEKQQEKKGRSVKNGKKILSKCFLFFGGDDGAGGNFFLR
jgi:hypothetical protein